MSSSARRSTSSTERLAASLAIGLAFVVSASLRAEAAPPYRFATEGNVKLTAEALPHEVHVLNDTSVTLELQVVLQGPFVPGAAEPPAAAIEAHHECVEIAAGGSCPISLRLIEGADFTAGAEYRLAVFATGGPVIRKSVTLSTPTATPPTRSVPRLSSWTMKVWRWIPFLELYSEGRPGACLPLKKTATVGGDPDPLGYLSSDSAIVSVRSGGNCKPLVGSDTALQGIRLELSGVGHSGGKYTGSILQGADNTGGTSLTAVVKDIIIWPIFALAIGLVLARWGQRYLQVQREIWQARERSAQVAKSYRQAQTEFQELSADLLGFTLAADLRKRRNALKAELDSLSGLTGKAVKDEPKYKSTLAELGVLEAAVASWVPFGKSLVALDGKHDTLLETAAKLDRPPDARERTEPYSLQAARTLLAPRALTIAELEIQRTKAEDLRTLIDRWPEIEARVRAQKQRIEKLRTAIPAGHQDLTTLHTVKEDLQGAWEALWRADAAAELAQVVTDLDRTRVTLDKLGHHLPASAKPLAGWSALTRKSGDEDWREAAPEPSDEVPPEHFADLNRRYATLLLVLAFVLALFSGLNQLYFDKAFSTPLDYLNAIAWGAGTKLALDTVVAGIGRLPLARGL